MSSELTAYELTNLDGLRVATQAVPGVRSVSIGVWIATGARHEREDQSGYAHCVEHLLFKGNPAFDATDVSDFFDRIGTDANAATSHENTVVYARVLDTHVESTLRALGQMVLAPGFADRDVETERDVILDEIAMYEDSPSDVVHELSAQLLYGTHPLARAILGSEESIGSVGGTHLAAFHSETYTLPTMALVAVGNVQHRAFLNAVRRSFLPAASQVHAEQSPLVERAGARNRRIPALVPVVQAVEKDTEQVQIALAGRSMTDSDPRRFAASVLDVILGGPPSSRLFTEVREKRGLAYSVYSFHAEFSDAGHFGVSLGVRPDRLAESLEVVRTEIDRIVAQPPTADELERAKDHIEGRLLLALESTNARMNRLGGAIVASRPVIPVERILEFVRSVSADDVQACAADVFADDNRTCAIVAADTDEAESAVRESGLVSLARGQTMGEGQGSQDAAPKVAS